MSENTKTAGDGVSRRTVTKAMAWAVPAIAVAAPIPAFAASGTKPTITVGTACKSPGGSCATFKFGYAVPVSIYNGSNKTVWITSLTLTKNTTGIPLTAAPVPPLPWEIAPGATFNGYFLARSTNSANATGTIAFAAGWGHASDGSDHDHDGNPIVSGDIAITGTPPDCACI
ncbi:hypothetical protein [Microbacterium arabinogalactanolyticum]|jgi:hypothetical protein|uniref:hypothetical protein n=1 Tax=Microbacterium arabinogalactanolyticum TaxID=69365 RepID=UPI00255766BC|nr:hypothetical protein [Microbacterium arabinogalactanolyticum]GLC85339.1 hypothetical protein MIAR_19260 [Microbacterium arabinogalactanolyticum]